MSPTERWVSMPDFLEELGLEKFNLPFERFTERARNVPALALEEARTLNHYWVGTEHILLGVVREEEGFASRFLEEQDITLERLRAQVVRIVGPGIGEEMSMGGPTPLTPNAKRALQSAVAVAFVLGDELIGTEHILLGLIIVQGVAERILLDFDLDGEKIRKELPVKLNKLGDQVTVEFPEWGLPELNSGKKDGKYLMTVSLGGIPS